MTKSQPKPQRRYKRCKSESKREAVLHTSGVDMTDKAVCDQLSGGAQKASCIRQPASPRESVI